MSKILKADGRPLAPKTPSDIVFCDNCNKPFLMPIGPVYQYYCPRCGQLYELRSAVAMTLHRRIVEHVLGE